MARRTATVETFGSQLERTGERVAAHPVARRLARFGFFCKAAVYTVMSALALLAAAGMGGRATDTRGVIATLAREPYGRALVAVLAVGMVSLGVWFVVDSLAKRDRDWKALVVRAGQLAGGLLYAGLGAWAASLAFGEAPGPSSNRITRSITAQVLGLPGGRVLVSAGGAVLLGIAFNQARNGWRSSKRPQLALGEMPAQLRAAAPWLALVGYGAQALVLALMGVFLFQAAFERQAHEATGFDGALAVVADKPPGMALLAIVATGLLCYAATAAIEGRYKRL